MLLWRNIYAIEIIIERIMSSNQKAKNSSSKSPVEFSLIGFLIAIFLTCILAMANAYLALKVGILTSASIPAAVLGMSILKLFRRNNILENNLIQTAASAGEAIAGGIVYTIPALIIIRYWTHFPYWENVLIALIGGGLGVVFSIPLRRVLVHQPKLPFPEGKAVAEVLLTSQKSVGTELLKGGLLGALLELMQVGFKVIANSFSVWFTFRRMIFGFGMGFSATLIGAGYLIGFEIGLSIFIGAIVGWVISIPVASLWYPKLVLSHHMTESIMHIWNAKIRYVGIGAMLCAGVITFLSMMRPLYESIKFTLSSTHKNFHAELFNSRVERDISFPMILLLASLFTGILFLFLQSMLPFHLIQLPLHYELTFSFFTVIYIVFIGFIFATITAFFSGLVGVSASPGSSVIIAGMLLAAWLLLEVMSALFPMLSSSQIKALEATTIIIGSVITGIAAISNDNIQDLKVGQLVGATPWKQQVMLFVGVIVSSLVIPPIMQLLFDVHGIAGVMPHPKMDISQSLPAPPAALMAAVTQAIFHHGMPWLMLFIGAGLVLCVVIMNQLLAHFRIIQISALGFAIGIYLPMTTSIPLFLGGLIAFLTMNKLKKQSPSSDEVAIKTQRGLLAACGLVAGAAIMDVFLAVPFSIARTPDVLRLSALVWHHSDLVFALISTALLFSWFTKIVCRR